LHHTTNSDVALNAHTQAEPAGGRSRKIDGSRIVYIFIYIHYTSVFVSVLKYKYLPPLILYQGFKEHPRSQEFKCVSTMTHHLLTLLTLLANPTKELNLLTNPTNELPLLTLLTLLNSTLPTSSRTLYHYQPYIYIYIYNTHTHTPHTHTHTLYIYTHSMDAPRSLVFSLYMRRSYNV
jgi:hypothetical protein